ncbi:class I SAM-dependent methyltransferase [Bacteroidota bacterium]
MIAKKDGNLEDHWNKVYSRTEDNKLGWYETNFGLILGLLDKVKPDLSSRILVVGAGNTLLIDDLIGKGYSNLIASDISKVALDNLAARTGNEKVDYIVDDLTKPTGLESMDQVDLWIDRAVLHFFTENKDQQTYFDLLRQKIKQKGFAIFAEFNLEGATTCSGLPVFRYNAELLSERMGPDYSLVESFDHTYINPSGGERPYVYTLFKRNS